MNLVIPLAGSGSRFLQAGYNLPKPMIDVLGKPMIEKVIENINLDAKYHFIVQEEHIVKYDIDLILKSKISDCKIVTVKEKTQGAACSAILAYEEAFDNEELIITNCDQLFDWDAEAFLTDARKMHGALLCHLDDHPKWSYCQGKKLSQNQLLVKNVVEKPLVAPVDNFANVGFYYWKKGAYFKYGLNLMMEKKDMVNGEYYIAPTYNYINGYILASLCKKMYGLGTPEDLQKYERQFNLDNKTK